MSYIDKRRIIPIYQESKHYGYYDNRNDNKTIKQLLENKRPNIAEVELTLFENCDINCSFCFHDKKSDIGMNLESIYKKLDIINKFFNDRNGTVDYMQVNIVGGELFQDRLLDKWIPIYKEIAYKINESFKKYDYKELSIVWVSNFLFNDSSSIIHLLESIECKTSLIVSYDPSGRPINETYKKNVEKLKSFISTINTVATKQSIDNIIKGDKYFSFLYDNYEIFIDDYIPDQGFENQIPKDSELLNFYNFLIKEYPNVINIKELVYNRENPMGCLSLNKITIFPDNSISNCKWHRYKPSNFETYKTYSSISYLDNAPQMERHLNHYNCLSCEFYHKCKFRCYTQWDYISNQHDMDECWIKEFFIINNL